MNIIHLGSLLNAKIRVPTVRVAKSGISPHSNPKERLFRLYFFFIALPCSEREALVYESNSFYNLSKSVDGADAGTTPIELWPV